MAEGSFARTGERALANLCGVWQVARCLRNLYPPIENEQLNIATNPLSQCHFEIWPMILNVFGEGGIPVARKLDYESLLPFIRFTA
jgi:hypothetical protein